MTHAELVELEKKASPRPWTVQEKLSGSENHKGWSLWTMIPEEGGGDGKERCWLGDISPVIENDGDPSEQGKANAGLIPALRNAAPAYFAVVEKAKAFVEAVDKGPALTAIRLLDALRKALAGLEEG